jgi:SAM-dependent methyltransferase
VSSGEQRDWDAIAALDPRWAVLSDPSRKYGGWDDEAFFASGEEEVAARLRPTEELGRPAGREAALDFGCGLGRVTRALSARFERCVGVDVSRVMVERAKQLNADVEGCSFVLNTDDDLGRFGDASFDLVYSSIVLQHLPGPAAVAAWLHELVRVTRPDGLLLFQLPSSLPLALRLQPRRTLYRVLRRLGASPAFLYWRLGLHAMRMTAMPAEQVVAVVEDAGGEVLRMEQELDPRFPVPGGVYYVSQITIPPGV